MVINLMDMYIYQSHQTKPLRLVWFFMYIMLSVLKKSFEVTPGPGSSQLVSGWTLLRGAASAGPVRKQSAEFCLSPLQH